jgi:hypothetical protein
MMLQQQSDGYMLQWGLLSSAALLSVVNNVLHHPKVRKDCAAHGMQVLQADCCVRRRSSNSACKHVLCA